MSPADSVVIRGSERRRDSTHERVGGADFARQITLEATSDMWHGVPSVPSISSGGHDRLSALNCSLWL